MRRGLAAGAAVPGIVRRRLQAGARTQPGIAAIDRGIEQFRQRRPDRLHVGPMRLGFGALDLEVLDLGVLPGFLGVSGVFAMAGIWDESGGEKRVKARVRTRGVHCRRVASAVSRCQQRRRNALRLRRSLDDIEMDPAALRASHGPVFGVAAGDNAQHGKPRVAVRTAGRRLRRGGRARLGFAWRHGCSHFRAGYGEVWRSADGGIIPGRCLNWSISVFASAMAAS